MHDFTYEVKMARAKIFLVTIFHQSLYQELILL